MEIALGLDQARPSVGRNAGHLVEVDVGIGIGAERYLWQFNYKEGGRTTGSDVGAGLIKVMGTCIRNTYRPYKPMALVRIGRPAFAGVIADDISRAGKKSIELARVRTGRARRNRWRRCGRASDFSDRWRTWRVAGRDRRVGRNTRPAATSSAANIIKMMRRRFIYWVASLGCGAAGWSVLH